jgi:hypothetical protein
MREIANNNFNPDSLFRYRSKNRLNVEVVEKVPEQILGGDAEKVTSQNAP